MTPSTSTSTELDTRRTRLAGGGATLLSSHARTSPTGDERHSERQSGQTADSLHSESARRRSRSLHPPSDVTGERIQTASCQEHSGWTGTECCNARSEQRSTHHAARSAAAQFVHTSSEATVGEDALRLLHSSRSSGLDLRSPLVVEAAAQIRRVGETDNGGSRAGVAATAGCRSADAV